MNSSSRNLFVSFDFMNDMRIHLCPVQTKQDRYRYKTHTNAHTHTRARIHTYTLYARHSLQIKATVKRNKTKSEIDGATKWTRETEKESERRAHDLWKSCLGTEFSSIATSVSKISIGIEQFMRRMLSDGLKAKHTWSELELSFGLSKSNLLRFARVGDVTK